MPETQFKIFTIEELEKKLDQWHYSTMEENFTLEIQLATQLLGFLYAQRDQQRTYVKARKPNPIFEETV